MTVPKVHNVQAVLNQAHSGALTIAEMKAHIKKMQDRGTPTALDAAVELRAIVQREQGRRAVAVIGDATPGSAKWAFSQLGAAQITPYRWSGTTAEGNVVVVIWDEPSRFTPDFLPLNEKADSPERAALVESSLGVRQNRNAYFRDLEVATASRGGLVTAILATAVDINAIPRQRKSGSCRPWLNEDGSPVVLRIKNLDIARHTYDFEFAEPHKKCRCPYDFNAVPATGSEAEDMMLDVFMREHPGTYYIEVTLEDGRRVDAVRVPGTRTLRIDGDEFHPSVASADGLVLDVIEVKQGILRRSIVDQAIGSAQALAIVHGMKTRAVAIVERFSSEVQRIAEARDPNLLVFATREPS